MTFEGLVEREVWVFAYIFAPVPIVGAIGSAGNHVAVLGRAADGHEYRCFVVGVWRMACIQ
jgi:hypothetical protein